MVSPQIHCDAPSMSLACDKSPTIDIDFVTFISCAFDKFISMLMDVSRQQLPLEAQINVC